MTIEIPKELSDKLDYGLLFDTEFSSDDILPMVFEYLQSHPELALELAGMKWRKYDSEWENIGLKERLVLHEGNFFCIQEQDNGIFHTFRDDGDEIEDLDVIYWMSLPPLPKDKQEDRFPINENGGLDMTILPSVNLHIKDEQDE